jgi:4-amino-4-deoxy-L-arabinose transferase-like glycosyltransferase
MYYYIFYRSKLIPRWLSGWGLIAIIMNLASALLVLFGLIDHFSTTQVILSVPIGLQEMVLAVWLIAKGFNPSAIASGSAKQI